jgi:ankyrin repeat protein
VVRVLINSGADINKAKDGIWTPLFIAAQEGHEVIVRALIKMGVDVNKAGDGGSTALYIAAQQGCKAVVLALIEAGADVNKAADDGRTPLFVSMTLVRSGDQGGHAAIVQMLRNAGAVRIWCRKRREARVDASTRRER